MQTQAVRSMAESAKRKSDALEEQNAIAVFLRDDVVGLPETTQFLEVLRKNYLALALKRAQIAMDDVQTISLGSGHEISDTGPSVVPTESAKDEPSIDIEDVGVNRTE